jgi:hypothetical protein
MIPRALPEITEGDLAALIANGVAEGKTIDYKRVLPGNSDADKKEFLADASSFANSSGGDLVFGIEEAAGLPVQIVGVQSADLDLEIRRLDSVLAAGLSPRIRYALTIVSTSSGQRIVILRVERSWSGPHRVIFQQQDKFYGRNSAGKYPLDVNELRAAFTLSETATERIRSFRTDRIIALSNNQTPLPFMDSPKVVLHCIPLEAFASAVRHDVLPIHQNAVTIPPMGTTIWNSRLNLNGVLIFGTQQPCATYTQIYRNGALEVVQGRILAQEYQGRMVIPSIAYEQYILQYLPRCFRCIEQLGSNAPIVLALTLLGTRGLYMGVDHIFGDPGYPIDEDSLVLPEVIVENLMVSANQVLNPLFDLIWNACGLPRSANFDADGNWMNRR